MSNNFYQLFPIPTAVNWNFTNICNLNCQHCYSRTSKNLECSLEEKKSILKKLAEIGISSITFGGGESLLNKDLFPILEECNYLNIVTRIVSNGTTLTVNIINQLKQSNIGKMLVSLDAPDADLHDKFRGKAGIYASVFNSLNLLNQFKIPSMVLTTFNKTNMNMIPQFIELLNQLQIKQWRVNEVKNLGNANRHAEILLDKDDVEIIHNTLKSSSHKFVGQIIFDSVFADIDTRQRQIHPGCHCAKSSFCVHPNGDFSPCVYYRKIIGNMLTGDFAELWQSSIEVKAIKNKKATGKCLTCGWFEFCNGGCFARAYSVFNDINLPDPLCWRK